MAKPFDKTPDWFDDRVEAFIDDELDDAERAAFVERLERDRSLQDAVELAAAVRDELRSLESKPCPPVVTQRLTQYVRGANKERRAAPRLRLLPRPQLAWAAGIAASIVIVVGVLLSGPSRVAPVHTPDPEVQRAIRQTQLTLAYISEVGRQTGETVRTRVMEEKVFSQVNRAFGTVVVSNDQDKKKR